MAALAWLIIPVVGAICAAAWARWATRARSSGDGASLAGYERFREAMQGEAVRPEPTQKPDTEPA
ncbi:hypothetical protein AB0M29_32715 [Streptomyces sp. NPDC051976]|uniref:hypothetical protein n=1 Tax=Streptomyces sp. NPDC051976 TaxID=3154947 RepID=UPI003444A2A8